MGTSGQRRRGIPHARDGDEFEPRGWTDRRTKIGSGMVGGPSEVRPLSSSNAVREREREKSGISSRTPDLFELFYLSFFHFSTSSSSPVFLQLPLFSFLLHRVSRSPFPSLSLSPFLLHLHRSRYPYLPLCSTFSSSFFSSIREGLHGTRNFSSPRRRHTQPPSKTTYTRATHEREREILASTASLHRQMEERPPIESRLEHLLFTFSSISTPNLPPRKIHDPEARLGRARALFLLLLLFLPPSRMSRGGSSTTTTTFFLWPRGSLPRDDRPSRWPVDETRPPLGHWAQRAPIKKTSKWTIVDLLHEAAPMFSCNSTWNDHRFLDAWWLTVGGIEVVWFLFIICFFFFEEILMILVNFNRFVLSRNIFVCIIIIFLYKEYERENMK